MKVFFHIPKTAGTSVRRILEKWFTLRHDNLIAEEISHDLSDSRPRDVCLLGHFGGGLFRNSSSLLVRYPWLVNSPNAFVFTFLRDPIKQAVSFYYHEKVRGRTDETLVDFLEQRHKYSYRNMLGISDRSQINAVLASFDLVGTTEDLQQSLDMLADRFDKPRVPVVRENLGKKDSQVEELSPQMRAKLMKLYDIENELYLRARDGLAGKRKHVCDPSRRFTYALGDVSLVSAPTQSARADDTQDEPMSPVRMLDMWAHGDNGEPRDIFSSAKPVGLSLLFDVKNDGEVVEPAITVSRDGEAEFSAAYVPGEGGPKTFGRGLHRATVWIPGNQLNPGEVSISASVAKPSPAPSDDELESLTIQVVQGKGAASNAHASRGPLVPDAARPPVVWNVT